MKDKLAIVCLCSGLSLLAAQPLAQPSNTQTLAGSWQLTFIPGGPTPVTPPVAPVPGLATFTTDGSVVETDGTEVVPMTISTTPAVFGTPGHGIWQVGPAVGTFFIQFMSLFVNQNATLNAKKTVTITGTLDSAGNNFTGSYNFEVINAAGQVITSGSGAFTAQKIPHPLLP
jgi:hypothetical protein